MVLHFTSDPFLIVQQRHQRGDVIQQFLVMHQKLVCPRLRKVKMQIKLQRVFYIFIIISSSCIRRSDGYTALTNRIENAKQIENNSERTK